MKRIPAVRAQMGIWVYYVSAMSFKDVDVYVKAIDDELHKSILLREMIQRSITDNYKDITSYLLNQNERFFNALILAVYDGSPSWNAIRIENREGDFNYDLGLLSLDDEVKIFPVDGQHRVAGIKEAIRVNPELETEMVPVVFISHSTDDNGMKRTRRLFSTLNRYAKPVSLRDIIALDEDDAVAIVSRNIIDNGTVFTDNQISDSKTKALSDKNKYALTSLINYYECNKELLWLLIKDIHVKNSSGKSIKSKSLKTSEFLRHKPSDEFILKFEMICESYWRLILESCNMLQNKDEVGPLRDETGGHLFYRPISLAAFTKAAIEIHEKSDLSIEDIIKGFPKDVLWLNHPLWRRILWDNVQKKMIMGNADLVKLLLIYSFDSSLLSTKEKNTMIKKISSAWDNATISAEMNNLLAFLD